MTGVGAARSLGLRKGHRQTHLEIARCAADGSLMLRQMSAQTIRHLPRSPRTCAGWFSGNGLVMLATSILSTCSGLEHCKAKSTNPRGAGMNLISEVRIGRQRAASSCAFRHPSDWQESRETLEHCQFWLWSIDDIVLDAGSTHYRARYGHCCQSSNGSAGHTRSTVRNQSSRHV